MRIRVREAALYATDCTARIPFRFGAATLTRAPMLTARVRVESEDSGLAEGFSADLCVPRWFDKDPARSARDDFRGLMESARSARDAMAARQELATPFDLWREVYGSAGIDAANGLVRGFGIALLERAVLDATCRAAGASFFEALKADLFGFEPGAVLPELEGWDCPTSLPGAPLSRVRLRHTVGLLDPLRTSDVAPGERVDDGLPQALEEDVRRHGLDCFKLKVGGDPRADAGRLVEIARLLGELVPGELLVTLDANEQYRDLHDLERLVELVARDSDGARLLDALAYVEQPLPRALSFDPRATAALATLPFPVILDEADHGTDAFPRAVELGYRGISAKNCKGVFRTLLNRGICAVRSGGLFQSAEDLTNLPVLPLQQDLATVAALGLAHVERNGHHYFHGLRHLPREEAEEALRRHPDLYLRGPAGITLRIEGGRLELGSLQVPGYGTALAPRLERRTPLADWPDHEA